MTLRVEWIDSGHEPRWPPDPAYPHGKHMVAAVPGDRCCSVTLPYPAKRCGVYLVSCPTCGLTAHVTTAGRPDDPRSLRIACKETLQ